jgi:hypothetical protein
MNIIFYVILIAFLITKVLYVVCFYKFRQSTNRLFERLYSVNKDRYRKCFTLDMSHMLLIYNIVI